MTRWVGLAVRTPEILKRLVARPGRAVARGIMDTVLDAWGRQIAQHYDPSKTVVVAGTPRGGTSWVSETLTQARGHLLLWEPLEPAAHAGILERLGIPHDYRIPHDAEIKTGSTEAHVREYLSEVLSGRVKLSSYLQRRSPPIPVRSLLDFERFVVKFVRGNLLFHWLLREFQVPGLLVVRHPCAVVASQLHFAWKGALTWRDRWIPFLQEYDPSLVRIVERIETQEEVLALDWAVTNLVPLREPRSAWCTVTSYEHLLDSSAGDEWRRVCTALGLPRPRRTDRPSSTTKRREGEGAARFTVDKWKKYLSPKQVDRILGICWDVGVDFYDDSPFPTRDLRSLAVR